MYSHETFYRVTYADTDQMRYMYYGQYPRLFEIGRVEAMRALGFSYRSFENDGILMPVLDLKSTYLKPAFYDELLKIVTTVDQMPGARIHFNYEIFNEENLKIHVAETNLAFIDGTTFKPRRIPAHFAEALKPFFTHEQNR